MPHKIEQVTLEDFNLYLNEDPLRWFRYEFTVTYNPKYIEDIQYAESLTSYVIDDIQRFCCRNQSIYNFCYNYVVEYQKNGYPHIHGTMIGRWRFTPQSLNNLEKALGRKYGKSAIYATGNIDRIHKNDHFFGHWSQYISKEQEPRYYVSNYYPF